MLVRGRIAPKRRTDHFLRCRFVARAQSGKPQVEFTGSRFERIGTGRKVGSRHRDGKPLFWRGAPWSDSSRLAQLA